MSTTPRTDAQELDVQAIAIESDPRNRRGIKRKYVPSSFARTLETELATLRQQNAELVLQAERLREDRNKAAVLERNKYLPQLSELAAQGEKMRAVIKTYGLGCLGVVYHSIENGAIRFLNNPEADLKGMQIPDSIVFAITKLEEALALTPQQCLAEHDAKLLLDAAAKMVGNDNGLQCYEILRQLAAEKEAK